MSGHNKWSTIKRKKGALDSKRSKAFSKIIKEITVAIKEGGDPDPVNNPRLRVAILNAKGVNMPKDNITRAISKASEKGGANITECSYEAYASHGVALFIDCATDNEKRTIANIRMYLNKHNGTLGTKGSLSFIFDRKGVFTIPKGTLDPDAFEMEMIDAGAEDISLEEDVYTVTTALEDFGTMQRKLEELGIEAENAELERIPKSTVKVDLESGQKVMKLIDILEDDDDVLNVFHNMEMTEELMDSLE
ncbi:MAG: YebC/PmpR family DNA-binding transcriptional regulator [Bacteroidota bacterium]|nr:YebC/PmpR family DNA-binding transcriptional regulator [Bacteroidota bacterium]